MSIAATVLVAGHGRGEVMHLDPGISFWGAIDPLSGTIIDQRHPMAGKTVAGKVIVMRHSIGSSSGSAVLLETLHRGCGPAAIILGERDQILTLGAVVAREMGYARIPVVQLESSLLGQLPARITIDEAGIIEPVNDSG